MEQQSIRITERTFQNHDSLRFVDFMAQAFYNMINYTLAKKTKTTSLELDKHL